MPLVNNGYHTYYVYHTVSLTITL